MKRTNEGCKVQLLLLLTFSPQCKCVDLWFVFVLSLQKSSLLLKLLLVKNRSKEDLSKEDKGSMQLCAKRKVSSVYLTFWQSGPLASCEPCGGMEAAGC